jgi:hypothetical protein
LKDRWAENLQPILALLDEGLALYRRNFVGFLLVAASWFVPLAIATGLLFAADAWLSSGWVLALTLAALLVLFPLLIYLVGGLSRAAAAAAEGRPVRFREAMAIHPLRAAGMGCFTIVYSIVAQIVSSMLSLVCVCPLYVFGILGVGLLGTAFDNVDPAGLGLLAIGIFLIGFYGSLMVAGATGSGLFYGLQPWVQESRPFGESLGRSLSLIGYRFWRNLAVWLLAALLVAAGGLTVMATIGTLLPLPLIYALGDEAPAVEAVAAGAWMLGLVAILPPLPIWMALLYRRNRAAYEGEDLTTKVREWQELELRSQESGIRMSDLLTPDS